MTTKPRVSTHPDHSGRVPDTEHLLLPSGGWADLATELTQGDADQIEVAALVADYDVRGEFRLVSAIVQSALSAAPKAWRDEHYDPTLTLITNVLDKYEATAELALAAPAVRAQYARATQDLYDVGGRVLTRAWSFDLPLEAASWDKLPGQDTRFIRLKAQRIYRAWSEVLGTRLKAAGLI